MERPSNANGLGSNSALGNATAKAASEMRIEKRILSEQSLAFSGY